MKVQQLFLRNVRSIKNLDLDFRDPVTGKPMSRIVLAGANGSGKTTILDIIFALMTAAGEIYDSTSLEIPSQQAQMQIFFEVEFPKRPPRTLSVFFGTHGNYLGSDQTPMINLEERSYGPSWLHYLENEATTQAPHFSDLPENIKKATQREGEAVGSILYFPHDRHLASAPQGELGYEPRVYEWAYKYQAANQWKGSTESYLFSLNYLDLEDRDRRLPANRFGHAVELVNSILDEKRIARIEKGRVAVETKDGVIHGLDSLSSGEKQLALLLIEIMRRIVHGSIILIDEPEISLHPTWQRGLVVALDKIIEQYDAQVIMATHSPEIASMVLPHEVMFLSDLGLPLGEWKPEQEALG